MTSIPGAADTALPNKLVLAVSADADDIIKSAASMFCDYANSLSNGSFTLTLTESPDPLSDLRLPDKINLALVDGKTAESLHSLFAIAYEPFSYKSYEDFSMTLNSAPVLQRLSDVSGLNVFAAYYTGSCMIVSTAPLDKLFAKNTEPEPGGVPVNTIPGTGTAPCFDFLNASAAEQSSPITRVDELAKNGAVIEITASELETIALPEYAAGDESQTESIVLTKTFHTARPTWLILSPALYKSLSPFGKAAIAEAAAALHGNIDRIYLDAEESAVESAAYDGLTVSTGFGVLQSEILRSRAENSESTSEEKNFRELLTGFS